MGFADHYLNRQKSHQSHFKYPPSDNLGYVVVIPAYCEPDITLTLDSLWHCHRPQHAVEVIIVVNSAENAKKEIITINHQTLDVLQKWITNHDDPLFQFHVMYVADMPQRDAGVGLARKTGMDEALRHFNDVNRPSGYILSFDADSLCESNYFTAIEKEIRRHRNLKGFDIYFEHPVEGTDYPAEVYEGMANYELHLRYVNQFTKYTGFPYAHHTVGSCFGVRADIYAAQGGMNKRKAGEDFYFLHKIISLGDFADICTTTIIPSPRQSFRVPFGTGAAIAKFIQSNSHELLTYSPESFLEIKQWFIRVPELFRNSENLTALVDDLPPSIKEFLVTNNVFSAIEEINKNAASLKSFESRFYRWFDAFKTIKYLNFCSRQYHQQVSVIEGAAKLLDLLNYDTKITEVKALLNIFRKIEREAC